MTTERHSPEWLIENADHGIAFEVACASALTRLLAENAELQQQLEAIGAGGVGPLIAAPQPPVERAQQVAARKDAVFEASIDFIGTLTGMRPPPIETAPPEIFKPFRDFTEKVCSIFSGAPPTSKPLTDEQIDAIADAMPGGLEGFMKGWGWRQFARAVLAAAPQPPVVDHPEPAYLLRDLADDISVDALELIAAIRDAGLGDYSINMRLPARVCVAMCKRFADVGRRPVARVAGTGHLGGHFDWCVPGNQGVPRGTLLYTRPQPQREPLTPEQIMDAWREAEGTRHGFFPFARAIERAHGIGGES